MENLTSTMGWDSPLARAELLADWAEIVGDETAAHAEPIGIEERSAHRAVRLDGVGDAAAADERDDHHEDRRRDSPRRASSR